MARCTLDDLVPSFRCNRIFLEPFAGSYSEYQVKIDASVYDSIRGGSNIADYLLTDTFKENVQVLGVYSRDRSVKEFVDFLKSSDLSHPEQSYVFVHTINALMFNPELDTLMLYFELISNNAVFDSDSEIRREDFADDFHELVRQLINGDIEVRQIHFNRYTNEAIRNNGGVQTDQDGNRVYDLKIMKDDLTFTNHSETNESYFHAVGFMSSARMTGLNIPFSKQTLPFFYKNIDECLILSEKRPANSLVQDFRYSERIQEIIQPNRINTYDEFIDQVSVRSGNEMINKSGVISDLYSSYVAYGRNMGHITHNTFYINLFEMCRRNSNLSFMYDNGFDVFFDQLEILRMDVFRIREDVDSVERQKIPSSHVEQVGGTIQRHVAGYKFRDTGIFELSDGEYRYQMEIDFIDPMIKILEQTSVDVKKLLSALKASVNYIHNNPQNYNEFRDELNDQAQEDISALIRADSDYFSWGISFGILFKLLTGTDFSTIQGTVLDLGSTIERRVLENTVRVIEDLLFAASKYINTEDKANNNATISTGKSKIISYSREWFSLVSPKSSRDGMIRYIPENLIELSENDYTTRMSQEARFHNLTFNSDIKNLGFITPYAIDDIIIRQAMPNESYLKLISTIIDKNAAMQEEQSMMNSLMLNDYQGYKSTISEIKNNSGIFESFLGTLGGTIANATLDEANTNISINTRNNFSIGIDNGENFSKFRTSKYGNLDRVVDTDKEELEEQKTAIKENLFLEKSKTEDLIMRMLVDAKGYGLLERKQFTQGDYANRRFNYNFNYSSKVSGKPHPQLFRKTEDYFRLAKNGKNDVTLMPISRFVMDNTCMVFYLSGFDQNMNPDWRQLTNFENVRQLKNGEHHTSSVVLCKMKRFQNSEMHIGQGSTTNREITSQYFYLLVD